MTENEKLLLIACAGVSARVAAVAGFYDPRVQVLIELLEKNESPEINAVFDSMLRKF